MGAFLLRSRRVLRGFSTSAAVASLVCLVPLRAPIPALAARRLPLVGSRAFRRKKIALHRFLENVRCGIHRRRLVAAAAPYLRLSMIKPLRGCCSFKTFSKNL
jgi:hypothetical protein